MGSPSDSGPTCSASSAPDSVFQRSGCGGRSVSVVCEHRVSRNLADELDGLVEHVHSLRAQLIFTKCSHLSGACFNTDGSGRCRARRLLNQLVDELAGPQEARDAVGRQSSHEEGKGRACGRGDQAVRDGPHGAREGRNEARRARQLEDGPEVVERRLLGDPDLAGSVVPHSTCGLNAIQ